MTIREKVALEIKRLINEEHKSFKEISALTNLNTTEIQNIIKINAPSLRYYIVLDVANKLGIKLEEFLVDEHILNANKVE